MSNTDKLGILVAIAVTAGAIAFVSSASTINEGSMQTQGELAIERTKAELKEIPQEAEEFIDDSIDIIEESIEELDSVTNTAELVAEEIEETIEDTIPEVPDVVKQTMEEKFLAEVRIPPMTYTPGCEDSNTCYVPSPAQIKSDGEVIWTNFDSVPHTVTSGNVSDGPDGLFDSELVEPFESYSLDFGIPGEYDYFCMVHPWMKGTVIVS